ncbi:hypothetical protein CR513_23607, partial [Mucuna pruriens]
MQLRRRSASRNTYGRSSGWKGKEKEKDRASREKSPKKGSEASIGRKELTPISTPMPPRASNIKCFKCLGKGHIASQCPNRSDDGEIGSEGSIREVGTSVESESLSDGSHYVGDLIVVRRLMNSYVGEEAKIERENIFHSRCLILGNLCSMIIDEGSCVNVASERLVKKLALLTIVHPKPYKLQWLSDKEELLVDRQVKVMFTLGRYEDTMVCNVVPMEASHLLLGRP